MAGRPPEDARARPGGTPGHCRGGSRGARRGRVRIHRPPRAEVRRGQARRSKASASTVTGRSGHITSSPAGATTPSCRPSACRAWCSALRRFAAPASGPGCGHSMGAGGPETCSGKDMGASHRGKNISEQEFVAAIDDAMATFERHGIDTSTRNEVLGILWRFKPEVVRV